MTLADVCGIGHRLKLPDGSEVELRPLTILEQGRYARWLEQRAHDAVDRSEAAEEAKDRRHAIIDRDAAMGKYEWDGPYALESQLTPAGMCKVTEIVCGLDGRAAEEVVRLNARAVCLRVLQMRARDPKALGVLLESLGHPTDWLESGPSEPSSSSSATPPSGGPPTSPPSSD
jgi:hypothetical protein